MSIISSQTHCVHQYWSILLQASNTTRQDWAAGRSRPGFTGMAHVFPSASPLLPWALPAPCPGHLSLSRNTLQHQRSELFHILGNLEDKRDSGWDRAFPHGVVSQSWAPGLRHQGFDLLSYAATLCGEAPKLVSKWCRYSLAGIPLGGFS